MRLNKLALSVAISGAIWAGCAHAAPNDPIGVWLTDEGKAKVEISACGSGGQLCSKIIWLREPNDSKGKPLRDMRNKDDNQRGRPILGLPLLTNLAPAGSGIWGGNIYNPEDGNTYKATMQLLSKDRIKLQGCAMFGLICGTKMWARTQEEKVKSASPATAPGAPPAKQRPAAKAPPPAAEPDNQNEAARPEPRNIDTGKRPAPVGIVEAVSQPAASEVATSSATVTTSNAAGAIVQAVVTRPVRAAAVANAAPVPAGPVAGEDMMFLAAPPPPEEAVSGTPMMLEGTSSHAALPAATVDRPVEEAAPPPSDYPASDAAPTGDEAPADDDAAAALNEEGDASPIPPLPTKAEEPDHSGPTPPLPVRAEQAANDKAASEPKQRKKTARHGGRKRVAKRAAPAARTAAKVTTKRVAAPTQKRAVRTAEAKTNAKPGKKREVLPWLEDGAKAPASPPPPSRQAAKPGSFRALVSPAQ